MNHKSKFFSFKRERGSIVVYASLIMLVMLASASTFSIISVNQARQAGQIDSSFGAFYAAESGVERSLEQLQYVKTNVPITSISDFNTPIVQGSPPTHNPVWASGFLTDFNASSRAQIDAERFAAGIPKIVSAELLSVNTSLQVDLFDPLQDGAGTQDRIGSIGYRWNLQSAQPEYIDIAVLDILNTEILQNQTVEYSASGIWGCLSMRNGLFTAAEMDEFFDPNGAEYLPQSGSPNPTDLRQYRLKATAVGNDLNNLEIVVSRQTCTENSNFTSPMPSSSDTNLHDAGGVVDIQVTAKNRDTTQALRSMISIKKSTSGLWDFTVFTNEPLEK